MKLVPFLLGVLLRSKLLSTLESISLSALHLLEKCMGSPAQMLQYEDFQYLHLIPTYKTI